MPDQIPTQPITPAVLDTILGHLVPHFMACANNDLPTARHAAAQTLAVYNAATEEELSLAAEVVSFGFHALEALGEAAAADLPANRRLRLCGSAVSLSREGHKARRKLDQLQRARIAPKTAKPAASAPNPADEQALGLIQFAREAIEATNTKTQPWPISRQQRRAAERAIEKHRRKQAELDRRAALKAARPAPSQQTAT